MRGWICEGHMWAAEARGLAGGAMGIRGLDTPGTTTTTGRIQVQYASLVHKRYGRNLRKTDLLFDRTVPQTL